MQPAFLIQYFLGLFRGLPVTFKDIVGLDQYFIILTEFYFPAGGRAANVSIPRVKRTASRACRRQ